MEENPNAGLNNEDEDIEVEYDEDGNPIVINKKKIIDPLPPIDHSVINYEPFDKDFYIIHEDIENLVKQQVDDIRKTLNLKVSNNNLLKKLLQTLFIHKMLYFLKIENESDKVFFF